MERQASPVRFVEAKMKEVAADQALEVKLNESCNSQSLEWEERGKSRAEGLLAILDTKNRLNDDVALKLSAAILPSPSLGTAGQGFREILRPTQVDCLCTHWEER